MNQSIKEPVRASNTEYPVTSQGIESGATLVYLEKAHLKWSIIDFEARPLPKYDSTELKWYWCMIFNLNSTLAGKRYQHVVV